MNKKKKIKSNCEIKKKIWSDSDIFNLICLWGESFISNKKSVKSHGLFQTISRTLSMSQQKKFTGIEVKEKMMSLKKRYTQEKAFCDSHSSISSWKFYPYIDSIFCTVSIIPHKEKFSSKKELKYAVSYEAEQSIIQSSLDKPDQLKEEESDYNYELSTLQSNNTNNDFSNANHRKNESTKIKSDKVMTNNDHYIGTVTQLNEQQSESHQSSISSIENAIQIDEDKSSDKSSNKSKNKLMIVEFGDIIQDKVSNLNSDHEVIFESISSICKRTDAEVSILSKNKVHHTSIENNEESTSQENGSIKLDKYERILELKLIYLQELNKQNKERLEMKYKIWEMEQKSKEKERDLKRKERLSEKNERWRERLIIKKEKAKQWNQLINLKKSELETLQSEIDLRRAELKMSSGNEIEKENESKKNENFDSKCQVNSNKKTKGYSTLSHFLKEDYDERMASEFLNSSFISSSSCDFSTSSFVSEMASLSPLPPLPSPLAVEEPEIEN